MFHEIRILLCLLLCIYQSTGQYYYPYNVPTQNPYLYMPVMVQPQPQRLQPQFTAFNAPLTCARLWNAPNFQGRMIDFGAKEKRADNSFWYFTPQSVNVKHGCSLTLYGYYGTVEFHDQDLQHLWRWGYSDSLSAACCQCNGCSGEAALADLQCARLYEKSHCNGCDGFRLDIKSGDKVKNFAILNNLMTSVVVRPGCNLIAYDDVNFGGYRINLNQSFNHLGKNWNKQISSVECFCPDSNVYPTPVVTIPTVPTERPTMTLPTVSTSKSPITLPTIPTSTDFSDYDLYSPDNEVNLPIYGDYYDNVLKPKPTTKITTSTTTLKTTTESEEENNNSNDWGFGGEDEEKTTLTQKTTTTTTTTPKSTTASESEEDEDDSNDWGFGDDDEEKTTTTPTKTTTTTPKTTTTTITPKTTTTSESEEDENDSNDWGFGDDDEEKTTTTPTKTTTTTPKTTTASESEEEDLRSPDNEFNQPIYGDYDDTILEPKPTTTLKTTTASESEEVDNSSNDWGFGEEEEQTTTTTTTITPKTTTVSESQEDNDSNDWGFGENDDEEDTDTMITSTTATSKTTTTTTKSTFEVDNDNENDSLDENSMWDSEDSKEEATAMTTMKTTTTTEEAEEEEDDEWGDDFDDF